MVRAVRAPDAGMGQQQAGAGMGVGRVEDTGIEAVDMRLEPGQELEAILAALGGVTRQIEGGQLGAPPLTPELGAQREAAVERDGLQAIFHHGADAHEADTVGHEGTEVTGGGIRNPDRGEALVLEQIEQVLGVAAVGLGLAHDHGADLGGLAHQKGMTEALHEFVKPQGIAGTLDADGHWARQRAVELLDGIARMEELLFQRLRRCRCGEQRPAVYGCANHIRRLS